MPQSFTSLHVHLAFSTKDRAPLIGTGLAPRLYSYIGGILRAEGAALVAAGGMPDHVHLLVSMSKQMSVSDTLRLVKANSSKWMHETFPEQRDFAWQAGYGAFAVSFSQIDTIKRYLANQAEHHRTRSFQEEFIALLERHHIEFDQRYIWD